MATDPAATDYRVAVSVAESDQIGQLMRTAIDIARDRDGDVFVISVVGESRSSPFWVFRDEVIKEEFSGDRRELLDRAIAIAEGTNVDVDGRLVVADSVASGILTAATDCDADAILMGWHARRHSDILMGHIVDDVVASAPCDVLVEKIGPTANGVETICLPAGPGAHTALAAGVCHAIARANEARVDVLRVVAPDASDETREEAETLVAEAASAVGDVATTTNVVEGEDVAETLVSAAEERDVTVIGGGGGSRLRRVVVGSTARTVGRRAETTVIVATRPQGARSWLARRLS
ncbi:universal stress protein [Haloarcula sp. JP-L23]|uniref:universal stress protein n=1 Tax=Haloarcula sp. JP-L23 TaxID=2716717 RepID=UPI00140ED3C7|nr:universal stress protein [Haloarcula sp. JP-L23]